MTRCACGCPEWAHKWQEGAHCVRVCENAEKCGCKRYAPPKPPKERKRDS